MFSWLPLPYVYSVTSATVFSTNTAPFTDFWITKLTNQTYGRLRTQKYTAGAVSLLWQHQIHYFQILIIGWYTSNVDFTSLEDNQCLICKLHKTQRRSHNRTFNKQIPTLSRPPTIVIDKKSNPVSQYMPLGHKSSTIRKHLVSRCQDSAYGKMIAFCSPELSLSNQLKS